MIWAIFREDGGFAEFMQQQQPLSSVANVNETVNFLLKERISKLEFGRVKSASEN